MKFKWRCSARFQRYLYLLLTMLFMDIGFAESLEKQNQALIPNGKCERIVSLSPAASDLLVDVGLAPNVVGKSSFCRLPKIEGYEETTFRGADAEDVGGYFNLNLEKVVSLKPDLTVMQAREGNKVALNIERLGLNTLSLPLDTLEQMEAAERKIRESCFILDGEGIEVSTLGGLQDLKNFRNNQKGQNTQGAQQIHDFKTSPNILLLYTFVEGENGGDNRFKERPKMAAGKSFHGELLDVLGLKNAYEGPLNAPEISDEALLRLDPDWIILLNGADAYPQQEAFAQRDQLSIEKVVPKWRHLSELSAVKNGRVFELRGYSTQIPTKRAMKILAKALLETIYQ